MPELLCKINKPLAHPLRNTHPCYAIPSCSILCRPIPYIHNFSVYIFVFVFTSWSIRPLSAKQQPRTITNGRWGEARPRDGWPIYRNSYRKKGSPLFQVQVRLCFQQIFIHFLFVFYFYASLSLNKVQASQSAQWISISLLWLYAHDCDCMYEWEWVREWVCEYVSMSVGVCAKSSGNWFFSHSYFADGRSHRGLAPRSSRPRPCRCLYNWN